MTDATDTRLPKAGRYVVTTKTAGVIVLRVTTKEPARNDACTNP